MKSEHRHELKTNELADWIMNLPQWLEENKSTVVVGAIIILGLIAYLIYFYSRQGRAEEQKQVATTAMLEQIDWQKQTILQGRVQGLNVSDMILSTAGSLGTAAEESDNPLLAALALIKRGEALRTELDYRPVPAEPDAEKYQLQQAKSFYDQALAKAQGEPGISAMAEYGTALCLEGMGDFNEAGKLYEKIATEPNYHGSSYVERAKFRGETMKDYEQNVYFAAVAPPQQPGQETTKPLLGPLKSLAPPESNTAIRDELDFNTSKSK